MVNGDGYLLGEKAASAVYSDRDISQQKCSDYYKKKKEAQCSALIVHSNGVDEPVGFSELVRIVLDKIDT